MNLVIAGAIWGLFAIFCLRARSRRKNTISWAILLLAVAMTLNVDSVYTSVEALVPIANLGDLLSNASMIIGLFLLLRAIRYGAGSTGGGWRQKWDIGALLVTLSTMVVSFTLLDAPETATTFMLDYGDQLATSVYSSVQYLFLGSVMVYTAAVSARNIPHLRSSRYRVGMRTLVAGCVIGVGLGLSVLAMNVLHLMGELELMRAIGPVHDGLRVLMALTLALGMAIPPLVRQVLNWQRRRQIKAAAEQVYRIWLATGSNEPNQATAPTRGSTQEISTRVHRMIIEIHDWANLTTKEPAIGRQDWRKIEEAERLCLHSSER